MHTIILLIVKGLSDSFPINKSHCKTSQ